MGFQRVDFPLGQHAAISDEDQARQLKPLPQLVHLIGDGGGIARIAGVDFDGHRSSLAIGHEAIDDDGRAGLAIAIVTILRQWAAVAFVIAAAHVIEHQAALVQVAGGELFLDARLSFEEPVHGLIQVIFAGLADAHVLGQGGGMPLPE
jgi:hypothetical protein